MRAAAAILALLGLAALAQTSASATATVSVEIVSDVGGFSPDGGVIGPGQATSSGVVVYE